MRTPLSYAAEYSSMPKLRNMVENGAAVNSSDWNGNTPLMHAVESAARHVRMQMTIDFMLDKGANPATVNGDGDLPLLKLERFLSTRPCSRYLTNEDREAMEEVIGRMLRRCKARETEPATFYNTLSQVVAQLIVNLIDIVTKVGGIELTDHRIAVKSSAQLFRGLNFHPTVSSIKLQENGTIEQETTIFVLASYEQDIADSEKSAKERLCPGSRPAGKSQPDQPQPSHLGMLNTEAWEKSGNYGGLAPSRGSKYCSYYLHRLAELQQRIFNVNRCVYYLDSNPDDCSRNINDLIAKVTGQKSRNFDQYSQDYLDFELGSDSSCEDDDVES